MSGETLSPPRRAGIRALDRTVPRTGRRGPRGRTAVRTVVGIVLAAYAAVSVYPFLWMVSAAFKTNKEVQEGGHLLPHDPTLRTFADTWNKLDFFDYFLNSVKVTVLTTVLVVVVYSAASYAFSVLAFPGKKWLYRLFLVLLFVPGVVTLLPIVLLESKLDILGTHWGLILPFVNGSAPLAILLLTNAFSSVPGSCERRHGWTARASCGSSAGSICRWPGPPSSPSRCSRPSRPGTSTSSPGSR